MDEQDDPLARQPQLTVLTDQFLRREEADDEARVRAEHDERPAVKSDHPATPPRQEPERFRPSRLLPRRAIPVGVALGVVILAVVLAVLQLRGPSRALADPSQAAAAAEHAGTFAFSTRSELSDGTRLRTVSTASGEIDLRPPGAFKVRVQNGLGLGFERVVFPTAVYFRGIGRHGALAWLGAHLAPPATITAHTPTGGGLGDPTGLLAILARSHHARYLGEHDVDHQLTRHYKLDLTLGAFLPPHARISPTIKTIPVEVDVWQNRLQRLVRAVRTFKIGGPRDERLVVKSDFTNYGKPTAISAPAGVALTGSQPLNPTADDPLGASVLSALAFGTGHSATPAAGPASVPVAPGAFRPGAGSGTAP